MGKPATSKNRKRVEQAQSGTARAALLGISDGLVTNVSLILGVAGAGASVDIVRLAGFASLLAGACSMAVGEYISMRGQVELLQSVLQAEEAELRQNPHTVHRELEGILKDDGVNGDTAHTAALEIARDHDKTMSLYARGKLGINPRELGSAWGSAISSFVMFSLGALVPLTPWFLAGGGAAIAWSLAVSGLAAVGIGVYLGHTTNGRWLWAGLRQLLMLILAAGITFAIGRIFHTNLA
jgi:VIT1/CCC1 family predicted Fe2+/Mn2+ transporter